MEILTRERDVSEPIIGRGGASLFRGYLPVYVKKKLDDPRCNDRNRAELPGMLEPFTGPAFGLFPRGSEEALALEFSAFEGGPLGHVNQINHPEDVYNDWRRLSKRIRGQGDEIYQRMRNAVDVEVVRPDDLGSKDRSVALQTTLAGLPDEAHEKLHGLLERGGRLIHYYSRNSRAEELVAQQAQLDLEYTNGADRNRYSYAQADTANYRPDSYLVITDKPEDRQSAMELSFACFQSSEAVSETENLTSGRQIIMGADALLRLGGYNPASLDAASISATGTAEREIFPAHVESFKGPAMAVFPDMWTNDESYSAAFYLDLSLANALQARVSSINSPDDIYTMYEELIRVSSMDPTKKTDLMGSIKDNLDFHIMDLDGFRKYFKRLNRVDYDPEHPFLSLERLEQAEHQRERNNWRWGPLIKILEGGGKIVRIDSKQAPAHLVRRVNGEETIIPDESHYPNEDIYRGPDKPEDYRKTSFVVITDNPDLQEEAMRITSKLNEHFDGENKQASIDQLTKADQAEDLEGSFDKASLYTIGVFIVEAGLSPLANKLGGDRDWVTNVIRAVAGNAYATGRLMHFFHEWRVAKKEGRPIDPALKGSIIGLVTGLIASFGLAEVSDRAVKGLGYDPGTTPPGVAVPGTAGLTDTSAGLMGAVVGSRPSKPTKPDRHVMFDDEELNAARREFDSLMKEWKDEKPWRAGLKKTWKNPFHRGTVATVGASLAGLFWVRAFGKGIRSSGQAAQEQLSVEAATVFIPAIWVLISKLKNEVPDDIIRDYTHQVGSESTVDGVTTTGKDYEVVLPANLEKDASLKAMFAAHGE